MVSPVQKAFGTVFVAQPHRQAGHGQRQVENAVHRRARGESAGVKPDLLPDVLQFTVIFDVLFIDRLLDRPDVDRAADVGRFDRVVNLHAGHPTACDAGQCAVGQAVPAIRFCTRIPTRG